MVERVRFERKIEIGTGAFRYELADYVHASDYDALAASVDRLTSDKARLAAELAATQRRAEAAEADMTKLASELAVEQESNTFLNNLHTLDADRIKTLETQLHCPAHPGIAVSCPVCHWISPAALETGTEHGK